MTQNMPRGLLLALSVLMAAAALLWYAGAIHAEGETIEVKSSSVTSEFPDGFRVKLEASGVNEIKSMAIRLRIGQRNREAYNYLEGPDGGPLENGKLVNGELLWRTGTAARYIPPGTLITYQFEIEDTEGSRLETDEQQFIYQDVRFDWSEVSDGPVSVAYHGPVKKRAQTVLDTIVATLARISPLLGAHSTEPIRVTMYNNNKEMLEALPPRSAAFGRELITEGQAFTEVGTLMMLGGGTLAKGTASHEVTHIIVARAGDSIFRDIPPWLNEGLAEFGNVDPGYSYDIALDFAIATDRLMPVMFTRVMPSVPEDVIIFYGQARSIVRMMVARFGPGKMTELMAVLQSGTNMDDALNEVYGLTRLELSNLWRDSVKAPRYVPAEGGQSRPTPIPQRAILPYSLTPQPLSEPVGARAAEPTPTPTPEPSPPSASDRAPTSVPIRELAAAVTAPEGTAIPTPAPREQPRPQETGSASGGCIAPLHGGPVPIDLASAALMVGLVSLALRKRRKGG